jgi:hypothetical protein
MYLRNRGEMFAIQPEVMQLSDAFMEALLK